MAQCLLWMDDVVLAETNEKSTQKLLDCTDHTSKKYHVEFGMPKTKYLRTGNPKNKIELKIAGKTIEETDKYVYLGEVNNKAMNLSNQIKGIEGKVEAAYQTIIAVAEDRNFKNIKMECIWKLIQTCITPIITYGCETWEPQKGELKKLNQILDKILKRILMIPEATPREALYIETGLLDIETIIDLKRMNMMARLNREKSEMMTTILENPECKWMKKTNEVMLKYGIHPEELQGSKANSKDAILTGVHLEFYKKMIRAREEKSKLKYFLDGKSMWSPEKPAEYMAKLTRKQASTIFKARSRMLKVKGNYKNGFQDHMCRACSKTMETQQHVLFTCEKLHPRTSILPEIDSDTNTTGDQGMLNNDPDTLSDDVTITTRDLVPQPNNLTITTSRDMTANADRDTITTTYQSHPDSDPELDIFSENPDTLKKLSEKIDEIMTELMLSDK